MRAQGILDSWFKTKPRIQIQASSLPQGMTTTLEYFLWFKISSLYIYLLYLKQPELSQLLWKENRPKLIWFNHPPSRIHLNHHFPHTRQDTANILAHKDKDSQHISSIKLATQHMFYMKNHNQCIHYRLNKQIQDILWYMLICKVCPVHSKMCRLM